MIHESSGDRPEQPFIQPASGLEVDADANIPEETQAEATVMPDDPATRPPTPPVHEKGDWEKFSDGEGPYPWHLV